MKEYTVVFKEPIEFVFKTERQFFDKENCKQYTKIVEKKEVTNIRIFHSLSAAKKCIKEHFDLYKSSQITQIWRNGDFENLGEINLKGSNKKFIANTRMTKANY